MGDLEDSGQRLEAAEVHVAVREDGELRIVHTDAEHSQAEQDGFTVYSARDMYMYVTRPPHERSILHSFKKRYGGTWEWKRPVV